MAVGLRARQRAQTRDDIAEAARTLFTDEGFEATTVAGIARRAGVSERTFYRYFPTKEHVALVHLTGFVDHGVALIADRPDDEHPLDSIRAALAELPRHGYEESLALDALLVDTIPSVAGLQHHVVIAAQDHLTEIFAGRLGVDGAGTDPADRDTAGLDARLYAVVCTAAYQAATRAYMAALARGDTGQDVWSLARDAAERLGAGIRRDDEAGRR